MEDRQVGTNNISIENDISSNLYSFRLTLISETGVFSELFLPKVVEGVYYFSAEFKITFINISERNGKWCVNCQPPAYFQNVQISENFCVFLEEDRLLEIDTDTNHYKLFVERVQPESMLFHNYIFKTNENLKIGRAASNAIIFESPNICEHCAEIYYSDSWIVESLSESCSVYVNGKITKRAKLYLGDILFIEGLRLLVGVSSFSFSSGNYPLHISPDVLRDDSSHKKIHYHYYNEDNCDNSNNYFNPAPRKCTKIEDKIISVEGPPMSMSQKQMPLMLRMGSSVIMGGAAALSGNFMTLITSVLFPFLSSKFTEEQRKDYEKMRYAKYTEYLEKKSLEIADAMNYEQIALNQKYPTLSDITKQDLLVAHLWERRPCDNDFLQLRLGTGERLLSAQIDYPNKGFALETDELEDKMLQLSEKQYFVENAPIILSLADTYVCGIQGERPNVIELIKSIVLQLATFHSYDEVKMAFLLDEQDLKQLDAIRYIPHVWDDMHTTRFVATNESEAYFLGEYIKSQLEGDSDRSTDLRQIIKKRPYYVVFALNKKTFDGHEIFKEILSKDFNIGVSVITAFDFLVKESQKIITLDSSEKNVSTTMGLDGGDDEYFAVDEVTSEQITQALHTISNISLKKITQTQSMPKMVTFLEMFNVGRIEQLNPLKRWRENNPIKSLATPVGLGEDGTPFILDLHEKRQGPHGLVAGMTGSGKSEFLITYILSMAVNYHPDEVSFVLIDYKGGGLASAFDNPRTGVRLPHLAGTITNLDGNSIQRSLMSIESELVRRQRVFNEAAKNTEEGTMNISTYQKLYRAGKVDKPMSHLFIISDEFAELKQQQPEFLEKLISAARIGRSLGVHLILATQKPSGVVNDQIRSNTKFQVCLRVQERSDSMDMIKRPDAAELTDTGRFYLQVGYNEYFALGQSAWCGADYEPKDVVTVQRDDSIEFIDVTGQVITRKKPAVRKVNSGKNQLVAIVEYLHNLAKKENIFAENLWLDELSKKITIDSLCKKYNISFKDSFQMTLGIADAPMLQQQFPYHLDIQHNKNLLIVGESGSGKTTFLQTLLYMTVTEFAPTKVQYYIMDFSSRNLKQFEKTPHCGAFITDENEVEIHQLFTLIKEIIEERKQKFSKAEVSNFDAYLVVEELPIVLLVIDDIARIDEMSQRSVFLSLLEDIMSNGASYGVKVISTINHINNCPIRLRRNIGEKIALRAKDRFSYSDILDARCLYEPAKIPGRGMCVIDTHCYEFQVAVIADTESDIELANIIRKKVKQVYDFHNSTCFAKRLKSTIVEQTYDVFCEQFSKERIPLGVHMESMQNIAIPLQQLENVIVYLGNKKCVNPVLKNLLYAFNREAASVLCFARNKNSVFCENNVFVNQENTSVFSCTQKDVIQAINTLTTILQERKILRNEYCLQNNIEDYLESDSVKLWRKFIRTKTNPIFVVIESIADLSVGIDITTSGILSSFLTKFQPYNVYFVICSYPDDEEIIQRAKYSNGEENASDDEQSCEYKRRKEIRHIWENILKTINANKLTLLFGGRYDKFIISSLPTTLNKIKEPCKSLEIDRFAMQYRGEFYFMSMPCEKPFLCEDEDECDIMDKKLTTHE